jgi:endonuclease/exonuclease/phosphatase family metal-dependent hydrolase
MRKLTNIVLLFFTIISGVSLLLAYLSTFIKPTVFWFLGIIGLAYPLLLLINIFFLVYWIVRWKWNFLIPFFAILIGISHLSSFFQFPFGKNKTVQENDIKIISYNVNLFQLHTWAQDPPTHTDIFKFLKNENADIICLQEFYVLNNKFTEKDARATLNSNLHIGYIVTKNNSAYGLATYSRFPIVRKGVIKFDDSANSCIYTDLLVDNDTIRVYNNHLQSLRLKERNLNFLLNQNFRKDAQTMDEIKDISFRYRDALQKRAKQVEIVTSHILNSPYPVIVCGDFNDSPTSYNYRQMIRNLNDAFVEAGKGVGHTYKGLVPSFRIDYILYSPVFNASSYYSPRLYYSDHYPVVATLRKAESK